MAAQRAAFPAEIMTVSPGYPWQLVLDVKFDGQRPTDWPLWQVRMHVWAEGFAGFSLAPGQGVQFETIEMPDGEVAVPVIRMSAVQTESLRGLVGPIFYVIDLQPADGEVEDYFAGNISRTFSPPVDRLQ